MSEKELTPEELEQAAGGRRTKRAKQTLSETGTTSPDATSTGPIVGDPEPLPDPPFQA